MSTLTVVGGSSSRPSAALDEGAFIRLEKLSRKAAYDSLRAHAGYLADDQLDSLAIYLLGLGIRAWERYDERLAGGISRETHAYRAMRGYHKGRCTDGPYIDWLRTHVRDSRFEPEGSVAVTESGELPEGSFELDEKLEVEAVVESYAGLLPEREAWTLRHVATALARGSTLAEVVDELLSDLADALRPHLLGAKEIAPTLSSFEELFSDWLQEAA